LDIDHVILPAGEYDVEDREDAECEEGDAEGGGFLLRGTGDKDDLNRTKTALKQG